MSFRAEPSVDAAQRRLADSNRCCSSERQVHVKAPERVEDLEFLEAAPVMELDFQRVGALLASAVCAASHLRHVYPRDTARHYLHPDDPEGQFVRDVVRHLTTTELEERWFAGDAARLGLIVAEMNGGLEL